MTERPGGASAACGVRRLRCDRAGLLVAAACAAAAAGWAAGPEARHSFASAAAILTGLGRLSGLLSAALLLVQVLLMAGPGWLTHPLGAARVQRRHRAVGIASLTLLCLHIALVVPGHAATTHQRLWPQLREMTLHYPGMLPALAGTVVLVLVAVTSARVARRRIGYRRWYAMHLYAYLGVGLALPHQLWNGSDLTGSAGVRIGWWAAWLAVAAVVLPRRLRAAVGFLRRSTWSTALRPVAATWVGALVLVGGLLRYPTSTHATAVPADHSTMDMSMEPDVDPDLVVPVVAAGQTAVDGSRIDTGYGPVQVQIRLSRGRIVAAYATAYPDELAADRSISAFCLPDLEAETVDAQSTHIDTVSGATSTSDAYRRSLQAALDAAHLQGFLSAAGSPAR